MQYNISGQEKRDSKGRTAFVVFVQVSYLLKTFFSNENTFVWYVIKSCSLFFKKDRFYLIMKG